MRAVTGSMGQVVRGMDKAMETMNLEKVSGHACVEDQLRSEKEVRNRRERRQGNFYSKE